VTYEILATAAVPVSKVYMDKFRTS